MASKTEIEIKPLNIQKVLIEVEGDTELIVHNWSEKAKREMLQKMQGKVRIKKEPKNPEAEYLASFYNYADGRHGFPATGFKAAIVGALRQYDSIPMTLAKLIIFVASDGKDKVNAVPLVEIIGEPRMREDMVRIQLTVDLRYRAGFPEWRAKLPIEYNANIISLEMLVNLVNTAGRGGIGEWRPSAPKSATGDFGRFHVVKAHVQGE